MLPKSEPRRRLRLHGRFRRLLTVRDGRRSGVAMGADRFSWLHLTDFHYGLEGQKSLWPNLREAFFSDLEKLHKLAGPWQAVLFTGDLVQSGDPAQFEEMQRLVLDRLWSKLHQFGSGDAVLLAVPGNHDLCRPDKSENDAAIDTLLRKDGFREEVASKFWDNPQSDYRRVINEAFAAYKEWWNCAPHRPKSGLIDGMLPGDFAATLQSGNRRIGIIGLNTTFLQLGGGDYLNRLAWDARQLQAVSGGAIDDWLSKHDANLILTHQGPNWLSPDCETHGRDEITPPGRFVAHLFGHMHETEIVYSRVGGAESIRRCQACSVFGMEKYGDPPTEVRAHGYTAGHIEFGENEAALRLWPRIATRKTGGWRFIPDHHNAVLDEERRDEGTKPETIVTRSPRTPGYSAGNCSTPLPLHFHQNSNLKLARAPLQEGL
jgi:Calcineurin-like phosphoesterase